MVKLVQGTANGEFNLAEAIRLYDPAGDLPERARELWSVISGDAKEMALEFWRRYSKSPEFHGQFDTSKMVYHPGESGEVIVVSFYYQWPIYVSLLSNNLANQSGKNRLLVATSPFRNEPYK